MAYSDKITISGTEQKPFVKAFSEIIRFIAGDPNTAGRDWRIISCIDDAGRATNFDYISYSGSLNVTQNNVWMDLPTAFVTNYTFTRGGQNLQEDTDYNINWQLGKIRFLTGTTPYTVDYSYQFRRYRVVLKNTGLADNTNIYIGMLMLSSGYDKANIAVRTYKLFVHGSTDFFDTTVGNLRSSSGVIYFDPAFGFWNGTIDLWVFSNKQRVIIVARNNTIYTFAYLGKFFPFSQPNEYPYSLMCMGDLNITADTSNPNIKWHDSTDTYRRFIANTYFAALSLFCNSVCYIDGLWKNDAYMIPLGANTHVLTDIAYVDGYTKVLLPIYIRYGNYTLGYPDGCYFTPGMNLASESTITVGSDTYIVFQNCFRTSYYDYMAIKCV